MLLTDSSEVSSAPVLVPAALVQASQVPAPVRAQAVVPAARLPALVRVPVLAAALASVQVPGFQPLVARPWGLRPCART